MYFSPIFQAVASIQPRVPRFVRGLVCPGAKEQGHRDRVSPLRHILAPCKWALSEFCEEKNRNGYRNFAVNVESMLIFLGKLQLFCFVKTALITKSICFFLMLVFRICCFRKSATMTPGVVCPFNVGQTCTSQA